MYADAFGVSKAEKEIPKSSGKPTGGRRAAHFFGGGYHTLATSRKGRRIKNMGRDMGSTYAGAAPGAVLGGTGAALALRNVKNIDAPGRGKFSLVGPAMMAGGVAAAGAGAQMARQANLTSMNRKGYLKAEEKDKVGKADTVSAFGVDHQDEIAKFSLAPIKSGFKAMKFGQAASVPKVAGRSYKAGVSRGQSKFNAGLQAAGSAIRHSPGTALAAGGAGVTGVGGAGYLMGRRKD